MKHLYVLYRETRQILKHNFLIALEEVLAVEGKLLYLLAINGYLSLATELGTR